MAFFRGLLPLLLHWWQSAPPSGPAPHLIHDVINFDVTIEHVFDFDTTVTDKVNFDVTITHKYNF